MPGRERGRLRIGGKKRLGRWIQQITTDVPSYKVTNQHGWVTSPPLKPASSHCIRGWHSLVYGQLSYMGQVYQSHPMHKTTFIGGDDAEYATRARWQGGHLMTYQKSFPVVEKMGSCGFDCGHLPEQSTEDGWRTTGKVIWLQTLEGTCT